ncbi:MAG: substrate-binding domain-containing protein [Bacilli bacterium]|nr:substrate-binding domain-containing protein [Bacilli bacterium]
MNKRPLLLLSSLSIIALTSCGLLNKHTWSWTASTEGYKINYCLLIGQIDHNDSMNRTRGVRDQLDTRVEEKYRKDNYNLEGVKQGEVTLGKGTAHEHKFVTTELESLEQKSFSGATWDPITANTTTGTWIGKHGKNITCFVSNNDGMAEGAIRAFNWYQGMPIFGYDANMSTLKLINQDKIMGTIDSNTAGQCLVTSVIVRNIHNASKKRAEYNGMSLIEKMWKEEGKPYNPIYEGFQYDDEEYAAEAGTEVRGHNEISYGTGYVHSTVTFDGCLNDDLTNNPKSNHAILLKNRTVTKDKYTEGIDPSAIKTNFFFNPDTGEALTPKEIYDNAEGANVEDKNPVIPNKQDEPVRAWQSWYSDTDTFFSGNMDPYFVITQDSNMFNIAVTPAKSDGANEDKNLNALSAVLTKSESERPNAFLINPVQQPNSVQYITRIADGLKLQEEDEWINRSDIPIIFWNRQPTDLHGAISTESVMNNKYFKYTYYIGFDAAQGGELQGQMVKSWLNKKYMEQFEN